MLLQVDFSVLAQVSDHSEADLLALISELVGADFVIEASAEQFAFRHALTQEAVYARILRRRLVSSLALLIVADVPNYIHPLDRDCGAIAGPGLPWAEQNRCGHFSLARHLWAGTAYVHRFWKRIDAIY